MRSTSNPSYVFSITNMYDYYILDKSCSSYFSLFWHCNMDIRFHNSISKKLNYKQVNLKAFIVFLSFVVIIFHSPLI